MTCPINLNCRCNTSNRYYWDNCAKEKRQNITILNTVLKKGNYIKGVNCKHSPFFTLFMQSITKCNLSLSKKLEYIMNPPKKCRIWRWFGSHKTEQQNIYKTTTVTKDGCTSKLFITSNNISFNLIKVVNGHQFTKK